MATVNFYLNSRVNKNNESLILLVFRHKDIKIQISTNEMIAKNNWDVANAKATSKHSGYSELNNFLKKLAVDVQLSFQNFRFLKGQIDKVVLKKTFETLLNPNLESVENSKPKVKEPKKITFTSFIAEYIDKQLLHKNPNTLKIYKRSLGILLEFEKEIWHKKLKFEDIDSDFYLKWVQFARKNLYFSDNTINKHTGTIKFFMNEAAHFKLHNSFSYNTKRFSTNRTEVFTIYLTEKEIELIRNLDLSKEPNRRFVRDVFVIGCYTGLRFSDLYALQESDIDIENKLIHIRNIIKTQGSLEVPILPIVEEIFKKYKDETGLFLPPRITNQKTNAYLKAVCERIPEFHKIEAFIYKKGGKNIRYENKKYELISTHTARRSFATNMYHKKIPAYAIMAITGHKSEKAFLSYIRTTKTENASMLLREYLQKEVL